MTTEHYKTNIELACTRGAKDLGDIQKVFFQGLSVLTLEKIQTTGSDFHKAASRCWS